MLKSLALVVAASLGLSLVAGCAASTDETASSSESIVGGGTTLLVSDIDDTIKRTDVLDKPMAAINGLQSRNSFSGMSLLYTRWHDGSANRKITYLSAAPGPLVLAGIRFLENSAFPGETASVSQSVVSGRSFSETAGDFKTKKLYEMYDASVAAGTVPATVILIGDNGEQDMLAYGNYINYVRSKGGRTDRIYSFIHHVYDTPAGSEIVAPHRAFVTAADLAVQLRALSLIDDQALGAVLSEVATDVVAQPDTVVPSFMRCSQFAGWPSLTTTTGAADYATTTKDVTALCNP